MFVAFISYRRDDSKNTVGRIADHLKKRFKHELIFKDVEAIDPGENFKSTIEKALAQTKVVVAAIGPKWLTISKSDTPRLEEQDDYVRFEIAYAIANKIPLIPIYVEGAQPPEPDGLPIDLKELAVTNGIPIRVDDFENDVKRLMHVIAEANDIDLDLVYRIEDAARNWNIEGRPDGALWRPPFLDELRKHARRLNEPNCPLMEMGELERDFFEAAEQFDVRSRKSSRRTRRLFIGFTSVIVCLFIATSIIAFQLNRMNGRLATALKNEQDAKDVAEVESQKALESFNTAMEAVRDMTIDVADNTLFNQPGMQTVQLIIFNKAKRHFEKLLRSWGGIPELKREFALAHFGLAKYSDLIEDSQAALRSYEEARRLQEELYQESPGDTDLLLELSDTYNFIGRLQDVQGQLLLAQKAYTRALELRTKLVQLKPDRAEFRRKQANAHMNLGRIFQKKRAHDKAKEEYNEAQKIRMDLLDATADPIWQERKLKPSNVWVIRDLCMGYFQIGTIQFKPLEYGEAVKQFHEAGKNASKLLKADPNNIEYRWIAAAILIQLSKSKISLAKNGHDGEANLSSSKKLLKKATQLLVKLSKENPDVDMYRRDLASAYDTQASMEYRLAKYYLGNKEIPKANDAFAASLSWRKKQEDILIALTKKRPKHFDFHYQLTTAKLNMLQAQLEREKMTDEFPTASLKQRLKDLQDFHSHCSQKFGADKFRDVGSHTTVIAGVIYSSST